jgi:hypothetical protein
VYLFDVQNVQKSLFFSFESNLFVLGFSALAGIVFILLVMALTTCIRHRRELYITVSLLFLTSNISEPIEASTYVHNI